MEEKVNICWLLSSPADVEFADVFSHDKMAFRVGM